MATLLLCLQCVSRPKYIYKYKCDGESLIQKKSTLALQNSYVHYSLRMVDRDGSLSARL